MCSSIKLVLNKIYHLLDENIKFILEDNKVRLKLPKDYKLSQEDKDFILNNKSVIISLLRTNKVFSPINHRFIFKTNIKASPLTSGQKVFLMSHLISEDKALLNLPVIYNFDKASVKVEILLKALKKLISSSSVFNMKLQISDKNYLQLIDKRDLSDEIIQIIKYDEIKKLQDILREYVKQPLDLINGPSSKIIILEEEKAQKFYLIFIFNHIFTDGWRLKIL